MTEPLEYYRVPMRATRLFLAVHPVYVGGSVVGSHNCLTAVRDSSRVVDKPYLGITSGLPIITGQYF
jgi:hypothetical protein